MRSELALLVVAVGASACTIDDEPYVPTDAAEGGTILLSQMFLQVPEGQSQTLGVTLAAVPAHDVEVSAVTTGAGLISAIPSSFTFSPATFAIPQTVTIMAGQDQDLVGNAAQVVFTANAYPNVTAQITIVDDDVQQIVTSPAATTTIDVPEIGMTSVAVWLAFQPMSEVTVNLAASGPDCRILQSGFTFTAANYSTPVDLFIQGVSDADTTNDACTVTLSSTTTGIQTVTLNLNVVDAG